MVVRQRAIGIFNNSLDTETALQKMYSSCCSIERVHVMASDTDRENKLVQTLVCESLRDRFNCRISTAIGHSTDSVEDDVVSLTDALTHLEIPEEIARRCNYLVDRGKYLFTIEGEAAEIAQAIDTFNSCDLQEWSIYEIATDYPEVISLIPQSNRSSKRN